MQLCNIQYLILVHFNSIHTVVDTKLQLIHLYACEAQALTQLLYKWASALSRLYFHVQLRDHDLLFANLTSNDNVYWIPTIMWYDHVI